MITKGVIEIVSVNTHYDYIHSDGKTSRHYCIYEYTDIPAEKTTYLAYDSEGHVVRNAGEIIEAFRQDLKALS